LRIADTLAYREILIKEALINVAVRP
jgi:hypothetical protein